jgi:hypothetical protein
MRSLASDPRKKVQGFGDMDSGFEFIAKGMQRGYAEIHPRTRASFYWAWGITPDHQMAIEAMIRNNKFDPSIITMKSSLDFTPACLY